MTLDEAIKHAEELSSELLDRIKALPPIIPQPKIGHWIKQTLSVKPFGEDTVLCDRCAFLTDKDNNYNYCPNCGAKMESDIHCTCTDSEIAKSFVDDVETVKDLLP